MNIVLVCITNFQDYILTNIKQLLRLGHTNIFVLTNSYLFKEFVDYKDNITLINVEQLNDSYNFFSNTTLDKSFRNGFWTLTSLRFFYLYEFMRVYDIKNVIHLENDVLVYYNCSKIIDLFDKNYLYIPFDTFTRNIASIIYIPSSMILKEVLDKYNFQLNDMENFSLIKQQNGPIRNIPIFPTIKSENKVFEFVTENFDTFNLIFDAAAIGQYLGGVDPKNQSGDTSGFVNETCVIKYDNFNFEWIMMDNIKRPFIIIDNNNIPIFNLHIHCKNLEKFI